MRALIGVLAVLTTGCYLAGYGSAPLETDDASPPEAGMGPELTLDGGLDAGLVQSIDASEPDALPPLDAGPDAHDARAQEPSDAEMDATTEDAEMDAAADDAALLGEGMDAT